MIDAVVLTFAVIASSAGLYAFAQNLRKARLIDDIPTSNIRSATQGFTELIGKAVYDGNPLYSPASAEACVWYYIKVELDDGEWRKVNETQSSKSFGLRDDTGTCYIYPNNKRLLAATRRTWRSASPFPGEYATGSINSDKPYRITEHLIKEHDILYALGDFKTHRGESPERVARKEMKHLLKQWKSNYPALLDKFDDNNDGHIDQQEWATARKKAYQEALAQAKLEHNSEGEHILLPPTNALPFIVANEDPKNLVRIYYKRMWLSIVGLVAALSILFFITQ